MNFSITGDYVTETSRKWLYVDKKPLSKVKELLRNCMCGSEFSEEYLDQLADGVLSGEYRFTGSTRTNDFVLEHDLTVPELEYPLMRYYDQIKITGNVLFAECEYGFINPAGDFIPVKWGYHQEYAAKYIEENNLFEDMIRYKNGSCINGDYLVYGLGWILLEHPQQGKAIAHMNKINSKQRQTLYDYYLFYGRTNEAMELYGDEVC